VFIPSQNLWHTYPEKLIPLVIKRAISDEPIPVYGDGKNIRDWLWVGDNCEAIDRVLHDGEIGEIYNIGAGNERKNIDVIKQILKLTGKPESLIEYVDDRLGHDHRYSISSDKLKYLGWELKKDFDEGLEETVRWYENKS
jgi:dTDP-glucose 4,6-dehydratase